MSIYSKLKLAIENSKNGVIFGMDNYYDNKVFKQFIVYKDYEEIKKSFTKTDKDFNLYEIYLEDKQCNYIQDLDIKDEEGLLDPNSRLESIIDITRECLQEYLELQNIKVDIEKDLNTIVLESPPTTSKASYHIIYRIKGYYFQNLHIGCKNFYDWMLKDKKVILLGVDGIYTKNRLFRILNSSKLEFPTQKLATDFKGNLLLTLGTYIEHKETDKLIQNLTIKKPKKTVEVLELVENNLDVVDNLLSCLKDEWANDYELWNKLGIMLYCIYNGNEMGKEKWKEFSQKCIEKYDEKVIDNFWEKYELLDIRMSIGSLHFYAKRDNFTLYEKNRKMLYEDTFYLDGSTTNIGKLFCNRFNDTFIYSDKNWHKYCKKTGIWSIEENDFCIRENLVQLSQEIRQSKRQVDESDTKEQVSQIELQNELKDSIASKLLDATFKDKIIKELLWLMYVRNTDFNNNPYIFAFNNGVYDLKTVLFRPGNYEEYIVKTTGYKYIQESSKEALSFIEDIIPDKEIRDYLLKIIASYLVDLHQREEFFVLYGRRGNNGKSTLTNAFDAVFGDYFYSCKSNILTEQKFEGPENASPTVCNMKDKRFISFQEISGRAVLENTMIKMLSGGDKINARKLHKDTMEFYINGLLMLSCNDPPAFNKVDGAIVRRMRCIEMCTEFVEIIREDHHRLVKDIEIKSLKYSLFQLLVENYTNDIKKGIQFCPDKIRETTESYFQDTDLITGFIKDNIVKCDNGFIRKSELIMTIKDRDISREYEFYNKKPSQIILQVLDKLGTVMTDRKKFDGKDYRNVILGYRLLGEDDSDDTLLFRE